MTYQEWIEMWCKGLPSVRGMCHSATKAMVAHFPELRRAAGFVYCGWGREQHWWCVAPDGAIVDPTKRQFDVVLEYEELDLNNPEDVNRIPIGKCYWCGEETYKSSYSPSICSKEHNDKACAEMNAV